MSEQPRFIPFGGKPPCPTCAEKDATIKAMSERTDRHCKMLVKRDDRIDTLEHDKHAADARATAAERERDGWRGAKLSESGHVIDLETKLAAAERREAEKDALLKLIAEACRDEALPDGACRFAVVGIADPQPLTADDIAFAQRISDAIDAGEPIPERAALASPSTPSPANHRVVHEDPFQRWTVADTTPSPAPSELARLAAEQGITPGTHIASDPQPDAETAAFLAAAVEHCAQCQTPVSIPPGYWPICQACVDATNAKLVPSVAASAPTEET